MSKNQNIPHLKPPKDLILALNHSSEAKKSWSEITPLARNEWTCWILSAKKLETRSLRIMRTCTDLAKGKKRPCCWPGCPHR